MSKTPNRPQIFIKCVKNIFFEIELSFASAVFDLSFALVKSFVWKNVNVFTFHFISFGIYDSVQTSWLSWFHHHHRIDGQQQGLIFLFGFPPTSIQNVFLLPSPADEINFHCFRYADFDTRAHALFRINFVIRAFTSISIIIIIFSKQTRSKTNLHTIPTNLFTH